MTPEPRVGSYPGWAKVILLLAMSAILWALIAGTVL
jgi:hypothetical protein